MRLSFFLLIAFLWVGNSFAETKIHSAIVLDWCKQDGREEPDEDYIKKSLDRREKRLALLRATFPRIVFTKHFDLGGSHYAYTEGLSDAQDERHFVPGTSLCLLELASDGNDVEQTLISDPNGVIRDPVVTYDGQKIIFSWKKSDREDDYHLYDYDVQTGAIRQLTFGLGYADYEPCVLPDGDIIFNSSRCVQVVDCWWTEVSNLYVCDKDGQAMRRLTYDQVHTNWPALMDDGRVIYTRWDYNDRGQIFPQALFQMNHDGTAQTEFYGNNSWFPTTIMHAREIPDSGGKVLAILSGHHNRQYGKLGVIDPAKGRQEHSGVQLVAPIRETMPDRIDAWGQHGDRFSHPYPINEQEYLVTYHPDPHAGHHVTTPFGIYWINDKGERELLAWDEKISCNQPFPLIARKPALLRDSQVTPSQEFGTFTMQDVYFGPAMDGVERGTAKTLRVIALDYRTVGIGANSNGGEAGGAMVCTPVSIGNGTWDVKIPLGDTPIYEDGSASFLVPAKTPVYFQVLDENGHCIQTMRSWATLQPGEVFSCVGCHENKNSAVASSSTTVALQKGPQPLIPFYGAPRGFSFVHEIQPLLDRHCISCHKDSTKQPPYALDSTPSIEDDLLAFSLKGDAVHDPVARRNWSEAYLNLTNSVKHEQGGFHVGRRNRAVQWIDVQESPEIHPPYRAGAAVSGLIKMLDPHLAEQGQTHQNLQLSREELDKLACWIDLLVPYTGNYFECHAWDEEELKKYEYFEAKRQEMKQFE